MKFSENWMMKMRCFMETQIPRSLIHLRHLILWPNRRKIRTLGEGYLLCNVQSHKLYRKKDVAGIREHDLLSTPFSSHCQVITWQWFCSNWCTCILKYWYNENISYTHISGSIYDDCAMMLITLSVHVHFHVFLRVMTLVIYPCTFSAYILGFMKQCMSLMCVRPFICYKPLYKHKKIVEMKGEESDIFLSRT